MNPLSLPQPNIQPKANDSFDGALEAQPNIYGNNLGVVDTPNTSRLDTSIAIEPDVTITLQDNIYDQETKQDAFPRNALPDPTRHIFFLRFFVGMSYPFEAIKLCFTKYYAIVAFFDSILITLVILGSIALGCFLGYITVSKSIAQPIDEWQLLWGFIWYNYYGLWIIFIIVLCLLFSSILLFIGFFLVSFIINQNTVKLSYLVEREMTGGKVDYHDLCFGEQMDKKKFGTMDWVKDYFTLILMGYLKRALSMAKSMVRRYAIKAVQFVLTRALTALFTFPIPGLGWIAYIFIFVCLSTLDIPSFGLDIIFERRHYTFWDSQKTIWNNLGLILGCGAGIIATVVIFPPFLVIIYPVIIISTTRLFVHLEAHDKTRKQRFRLLW